MSSVDFDYFYPPETGQGDDGIDPESRRLKTEAIKGLSNAI